MTQLSMLRHAGFSLARCLSLWGALIGLCFGCIHDAGATDDAEYYYACRYFNIFTNDVLYPPPWPGIESRVGWQNAYHNLKRYHEDRSTHNVQGVLPQGVSWDVCDVSCGSEEQSESSCEWSYDYYSITGSPTRSTAIAGFENEFQCVNTHASRHCINGSWITEAPTICKIYVLCRADDYPDAPGDTLHAQEIAALDEWDAEDGFMLGYLQAERYWYPDSYTSAIEPQCSRLIPADMDVLELDEDAGVYCVETEKQLVDFDSALIVSVFKKKANANEYDGDFIARTNKFNVYNNNGYIDYVHQRVYFTLDNDNGAYVQIGLADPSKASSYKVRVFRARPVILVHGIDSKPWTQAEAREGKNALGNWEDCLPWDANAYPCVCYNFAWDPAQNNLRHDNVGKIHGIIQQDPQEADNPYVGKLYEKHGMNVALIGHSMGGFVVRFALNKDDSRSKIYKVVLLGSPMYGSDIALGPLLPWWKNTSENNLRALRRGSEFVNFMHDWLGVSKCLCIAGKDAPPRLTKGIIPYDRGLGYSDGVVPVSSALLEGAANNLTMRRDHGTVGLASYIKDSEYPFNPAPAFPGIVNRPDPCTGRRNKPDMFADTLYKTVRDYIK